jgi:signal transduction histidine kinase
MGNPVIYEINIIRQRRSLLLAGVLFLGLYFAWLLWGRSDPWERFLVGNLAMIFTSLLAVLLALWVYGQVKNSETGRPWKWLAGGLLLWSLGDIVRMVIASLNTSLVFRFGALDIIYLLGSVFLWVGLILYPRKQRRLPGRLGLLVDIILSTTAILTLVWIIVVQPILSIQAGKIGDPAAILYPTADLISLILLMNLFLISDSKAIPAPLGWIGLGIIAYSVSDLAYSLQIIQGRYQMGNVFDLGWILGDILMVMAVLVEVNYFAQDLKAPFQFLFTLINRFQSYLPLISILLLGWYTFFNWQLYGSFNMLGLWTTALLGLGLIARQGIQAGEIELRNAYDQIAADRAELEMLNEGLEQMVAEKTENLRQAYQRLEEQNISLQKLDELKSEFVTMVSHELRAPLTNINGGIELILAGHNTLPERPRQNMQLVQAEIQRLNNFVETILDLSALEAGKLPLFPAPLNLQKLVEKLHGQMTHLSGSESIHLDIPDDLPLLVADERALTSVIFHLLDNAIKYAPQVEIKVSAGVKNGRAWIRVSDQGPGVPEDELSSIFDRFYRSRIGNDAQTVYGYGLGLSISRRLMEAMDGSLEAENQKGGGACFTGYLPVLNGKE